MDATVIRIEPSEAHPFILRKHYAKRLPSISHAFGLFVAGVLQGIVTFGTPASSTLLRGICGDEHAKKVLELNRLCINDGLAKNSASYLVSRALRLLPRPSIVVSYADTGNGHVGYIYQACNFTYTGLSSKFKDPKVKGLEHQHHATYAHGMNTAQLREKFGDRLYYADRPRKHRYIIFLGCDKAIVNALKYPHMPYPKGDTKRHNEDVRIDIAGDQTRLDSTQPTML